MNEYVMQRIESLAAAGRLDAAAIDQAVAKGLIGQARADAAKGRIPADPGSQSRRP